MSNIIINTKSRTIEMNKAFSKAASLFGTREYSELQQARRDYPNFKVKTVSNKSGKPNHKGLTFEYMEKYISKHDDEAMTKMSAYKMLRGISDEGMAVAAESASYADIKEWFFQTFPEIEAFQAKREELLKQVEKKRAERQAA